MRNNLLGAKAGAKLDATGMSYWRQETIREICAKPTGDSKLYHVERQDRFHYYVYCMDDLGLLWCPVYKVASNGWIQDFMSFRVSNAESMNFRGLSPYFC